MTESGAFDCPRESDAPRWQGLALERAFGWPTRAFAGAGHTPLRGEAGRRVVEYIVRDLLAMGASRVHGAGVDWGAYPSSFDPWETAGTIRALYAAMDGI